MSNKEAMYTHTQESGLISTEQQTTIELRTQMICITK